MPNFSVAFRCVGLALTTLALSGSPVLAAARPAAPIVAQTSVLDAAAAQGSFTTFLAAVKAADLTDTLTGSGSYTIFAPTDAAFAKLPADTLANLMKPENKAQLRALLLGHVIPAAIRLHDETGDIGSGSTATVGGGTIAFANDGGQITVSGAKVVKRDIPFANGFLDAIDSVLLPAQQTAKK